LSFQLVAGQEEPSPVGVAPSKPLDKPDGTAFPEYKVVHLYYCDFLTLLLSHLGMGPAMVEFYIYIKYMQLVKCH
jgi:hypothetical protein